jgi:hypothetical protein
MTSETTLSRPEAACDQSEDFKFASRNAERLLLDRIGSEGARVGSDGDRCFRRDKHFLHHHLFSDSFATARDAEAEPDAEDRE